MKTVLLEDDFDNGRTPEQLQRSFANSFASSIAYADGRIIGTARVLSDGVCNAYLLDVWTYTPYRRQGIARRMIEDLLDQLPGQHVYLFTDIPDFYNKIGFTPRGIGMERHVGRWLDNTPHSGQDRRK
jgi:GNAT superfamily N-acetyltransferase